MGKRPDRLPPMPASPFANPDHDTLYSLFKRRVQASPQAIGYRQFERTDEAWRDYSWSAVAELVARMQAALLHSGVTAGDRVAIMLRNCVEWAAFDQASLGLGLVVVPLYTNDRPDNVAYCLRNSNSRLLFIDGGRQWRELAPALADVDGLQHIIHQRAIEADDDDPRGQSLEDWLARHIAAELCDGPHDPNQLASIIYTSGTTGRPKGVMLSHRNMVWNAHGAVTVLDPNEHDRFLSFLPLSHTLERTAGLYLPLICGSCVVFARSIGQLSEDLVSQRPTILISVPRVFELIHGRIHDQVRHKGGITAFVFKLAVKAGWRRFEHDQGRAGWHPLLLLHPLLRKKVGAAVLERFGGHIRACVSGGAALPFEVARLFLSLGLPVLQGYGLTEHSPVISVNLPSHNDPRTVGPALPGIEMRLGDNDELLVRSPAVMLGYWDNQQATDEVLDEQGWLHTGDQARIDHRTITITGRLKEILVLSNGEKVPPGDMEMAIAVDPLIDQIMVVGEGRPNLTAIMVLNPEQWQTLAKQRGLAPDDPESLRDTALRRHLRKLVAGYTRDFPGFAQVRDMTLTLAPWTVDNGLLTATLKMRRKRILERHQADVDALYSKR